jgi:hypothetical protein
MPVHQLPASEAQRPGWNGRLDRVVLFSKQSSSRLSLPSFPSLVSYSGKLRLIRRSCFFPSELPDRYRTPRSSLPPFLHIPRPGRRQLSPLGNIRLGDVRLLGGWRRRQEGQDGRLVEAREVEHRSVSLFSFVPLLRVRLAP